MSNDLEMPVSRVREAAIRGAVIGGTEAFTLGATGMIYKTLAPRGQWHAIGAGMAAQTVGGVIGEGGAQAASRGELYDMPAIAGEAVLGPLMSLPEVAGYALFGKQQAMDEHQERMDHLHDVANAARESRLRETDPALFQDYAARVAEESGQEHLYIDGNALHQSGLQQAFIDALPDYADVLQEAQAIGGSVQIRTEDFLSRVAPNEQLTENLMDILRLDPDGQSFAELRDHYEAELSTGIVENLRNLAQMDEAERVKDEVYNHIHTQLTATGRLSPDAARSNALLLTAFFETMGGRMGENMRNLYERLGLRIVGGEYGQRAGFDQALAEHPPRGWQHAETGDDARALWHEPGSGHNNKAVFWTGIDSPVAQLLPQTAGYSHSLSVDAVRHIKEQHGQGNEELRGQLPVTEEDIAKIPEIVSAYDGVRTDFASENGAQRVAYAKRVDDGVIFYMEEASRKKKDMRGISMRKYPPTIDTDRVLEIATNPNLYVQNGEAAYADDTTLYQDDAESSAEQAEFAATAEQYGGEAAYNAARDAGETELDYRQWVQVRTPAFKAWFGDWEGDPDNASKVINERTGEPLVVYHGTDADFHVFDTGRQMPGWLGKAFYFSDNPVEAADYGSRSIAAFLNIRHPFVIQTDTVHPDGSVSFAPNLSEQLRNRPEDADGVLYGSYFAAPSPNQIKSATDNTGAFSADNDSILYQNAEFYSALAREVAAIDMKSGTSASWKQQIEGWIGKGRVKEDEVFWTGIREWLDAQEGKISREAVQEYLRGAQVDIGETEGRPQWRITLTNEEYEYFDSEEEARESYDTESEWIENDAAGVSEDDNELSFWTHDNEDSYTVTLEEAEVWLDEDGDVVDPENVVNGDLGEYYEDNGDGNITVFDEDGDEKATYTLGTQERYVGEDGTEFDDREEALEYLQDKAERYKDYFRSVIREPEMVEGNRNNDDAARYRGYSFADEGANYRELLITADGTGIGEYKSSHWKTENVIAHIRLTDFDDGQTLFVEELQSDWAQDKRKGETDAAAPFVDKTGKWVDLVLKRVMLEAVNGGYQRVAFINGQQSADRYSLDKSIARLEYDGKQLKAHRKDGNGVIEREVAPKDMAATVGEETAQKLLTQEAADGVMVLESEDMKMGGEGMRAFYDSVVPKALKNLLKKADKSIRLETVEQAETESAQLSFAVTETMREALAGGLPLFQNPQSPRGQFDPSSNVIALFGNADLSTLPHELGHFFLESMVGFANDLRHIDAIQGGQTLSESERGMLRDVDTLMDWFGVDLQTWNRMTLEEQRPYHEQFARGFEQYLLEGRAPSLELQSLFARFRAWLLNIYRHARNLNVPMTDEVRQVFDRLLASDEAIQLAEQSASMRAMFEDADAAGMDAQDFADYQRAHQAASDAALDEMQARSMRDVRLIRHLTGKRLRELQRESREKRAEVQMEARREILSRPVYRAWQMLTARAPKKTATKPKWHSAVDSRNDSLFVAIAKLGGLDAAQAKSEWGFEDKITRPHPHYPVLRREGGKKLDDMATSLMEAGYLKQGYHLNDFYDAFMAEFAGRPQYSAFYEPDLQAQADGEYGAFASLRLDGGALAALGYDGEQIAALGKMVRKSGGVHPDRVAELILDENGNPVYDSGDALVQALLQVPPPKEAIETLTDNIMLERYGELATPEALLEAAQMAVHNEVRLTVLATEANALAKATGNRVITARMARELARQTLANKRLRDIKPQQYLRMEARAARAAEQARKKGDIATAAAEKRNQVLQAALARAAYEVLEDAAAQVRMLKRMGKLNPKTYAIEYREQIEGILEKYHLRDQSGKALQRRQTLAQWVEGERAKGNDPNLPAHVLEELQKTPWQELTPEALQGVVDSVKQIAHLGKLKNKLLTRRKNQDMDAVKEELVAGIETYATESGIVNRTATDARGKTRQALARFFHAHRRAGMVARLFDGDRDGGVWWENIIRPMNDAANWQTATRTQAVQDLQTILQPLMDNKRRKEKITTDLPDLDGKRRSLSVEEVFVMALNWGNDGNKQRLLSGNRWNEATARQQLSRLTAAELNAVQAIWDYFEQFKPQVAALERRTKGTEPDWVEAVPFVVKSADGVEVALRGGYYPVRYDTRASVQAARDADSLDAMREQVGRTAMTTRQSYTKARADEVHDRPLMLDMSGLFTGLNEVIHDLAYREVLMDTQRLLGSKRVSDAVRSHYGDEVYKQLTDWVRDIAVGDLQRESALVSMLNKVRRYGTFAYLGYNLMSAAAQPLGLLQSAARVGTGRIMAETARYVLNPAAIARKNREANAASVFMADRGSTQMRELNELANSLLVGNTLQNRMLRYSYTWLMAVQKQVDVITWHAAHTKALEEGFSDADAVAIADQAVIDTQGSGMIKDLSKIERDQATRIFTVFYSFMNTILNLEYTSVKAKNSRAKKAEVLVLLSLSVPILNALMRSALKPGEDEDKWDENNWYKTIGREIVNHHLGLFVGVREFQMNGFSYTGPVGLHIIEDYRKLGEQLAQGDADTALRKALINAAGATTGFPSVALNRVIDGAQAMADGETENPAVMAFGLEK